MPLRFILIAGALFALMITLDAINGRLWLNDLRVYWEASRHFLEGESAYGASFGLSSGFYKYAPFGLVLFAPLALLPYAVAKLLFAALIALACVSGILLADRIVRTHLHHGAPFREVVTYLALLVVAVHLQREVHLGNVNMLLLVVLLLALERMLHGSSLFAGILFGGVLLLKPHFLVLLPMLVLHARWRELLGCALAIIAGVLLPFLFTGWDRGIALHAQWIHAMTAHNASFFFEDEGSRTAADTIYTVVHRVSFGMIPPTRPAALIMLCAVAAAMLWLHLGPLKAREQRTSFTLLFLVLIALVPSLTVTDTEHFLLSMPLVLVVLHSLFQQPRPMWLLPAAIVILFGYGGNWQDPLGAFGERMAELGVLGAANVLLVVLAVQVYLSRTGSSRA